MAARKEDVFFADLVSIPRHCFRLKNECIIDEMTELVEVFIVESLLLPVLLGRNHNKHSFLFCKLYNLIRIISAISEKMFRRNVFKQSHSFLAIISGTFCDKYSDRHTIRIHGKVNLGVEPPFVWVKS